MRIFLYAVQGYVNWVCRVGDRGNQGKESGGLFYLAVHTRHWQVIWILVTRTTLFLRVIDSSVYRRGNGVRTLGLKQLQKQTTSRSTVALSCGRLFTFGIIPQTGRWINVRCQRPLSTSASTLATVSTNCNYVDRHAKWWQASSYSPIIGGSYPFWWGFHYVPHAAMNVTLLWTRM